MGASGGVVNCWLHVRELDGGFRADPSGATNPHSSLFDHGETDTTLPIGICISRSQ